MVDQNQTTHTPRRYPQGEWPAILEGLGDTGRKIVAQDWSATPLGDIASWPSPLRTALSIVLASHQPMVLWWGEDLIQLHNDAYDELMSERAAPASIGQPAQNALPMDWQVLLDDMRKVIQVGEPMRLTDAHLPRPNDPDMREHYFCISVDPLFRDDGSIAGALAVLCESTQGVVRERRLSMLNDLAGSIRIADDPTAVSTLAVQSIGKNRGDVCFALIYLFDHLVREAQLVATSGEGVDRAPTELEMEMTRSWPLDRAAAGEASILLDPRDMSGTSFGEGVEGLGWISILPLDATHNGRPHGALVIGTSAAVHIDDSYREFLEVTADQIAAGIEARFQLFERTNAVNVVRHRMQNNLQLISSLFSLTRGRIADWLASQEMESLDDRLAQLGLIMNVLGGFGVNRVPADKFLREVGDGMRQLYPQPPLQVTVSAEPIVIRDNKAVAVGLLIGEVLTASKGRGGRAVSLSINLARQDDKQLRLVMGVTGTLSPEGWEERGAQHFLEAFSRQMRGTLDIERNEAEVKVTLAFPYNNEL